MTEKWTGGPGRAESYRATNAFLAEFDDPLPFQPGLPERALRFRENKPPKRPTMLVSEVLAWISFRRFIPYEHRGDLWNGFAELDIPPAELAMLAALNARAGLSTGYYYCLIWTPDRKLDKIPSRHRILTCEGPRILRSIRALHRKQSGKLLSFKDVATIYHNRMMQDRMVSNNLKCSMGYLRQALAAELLTAYGVSIGSRRNPAKPFPAEPIPHTIFMRREVEFTLSNTLGIDGAFPYDDAMALDMPRYEQITLKTSDVLRVWPPAVEDTEKAANPAPEAQPARKPRSNPGLDYRAADEPLVAEAVAGIKAMKYRNATDAARALASRAAGSGQEASKATRLIGRIKAALARDSDG